MKSGVSSAEWFVYGDIAYRAFKRKKFKLYTQDNAKPAHNFTEERNKISSAF